MKVTIKHIHLENYKGVEKFDSDLSGITFIKGKNGVGKSTIADAVFDVLTDKMQDGSSTDNVRPHDENGKDIDHIDVIRELTVMIGNSEYVLSKTTSQKWVRPRGCDEVEFQGNETKYKINDFDKSKKEFNEFLEDNICKMDMLIMILNAQPFLNILRKSTAQARDMLTKLTGFSIEGFVADNPQYSDVTDIIRGESIENVLKKLRKDLSNQKKDLEKAQQNLSYEKDREVEKFTAEGEIETLKVEAEKLIKEIKAVNEEIEMTHQLNQEYNKLSAKKAAIEVKVDAEKKIKLAGIERELSDIEDELNERTGIPRTIRVVEEDLENTKKHKANTERLLKELEESQSKPNDICPTCGQKLPEENLAYATKELIAKKEKSIETLKEVIKTDEDEIEAEKKRIADLKLEMESRYERKGILSGIKATLEENPCYGVEHAEICKKLETMLVATIPEDPIEKQNRLSEIERQISKAEAYKKALADEATKKAKLIDELSANVKKQAQACATIEGQIDKIQHFSIDKNIALAKMVNKHFSKFNFVFTDTTQEGNVFETLKLMCNGTSMFNGLNRGASIEIESDLVHGLQDMQGLQLPIIMDNTESLDEWRLPKYENQELIIRRTDDEALTVKGE